MVNKLSAFWMQLLAFSAFAAAAEAGCMEGVLLVAWTDNVLEQHTHVVHVLLFV